MLSLIMSALPLLLHHHQHTGKDIYFSSDDKSLTSNPRFMISNLSYSLETEPQLFVEVDDVNSTTATASLTAHK